MVRKEPSTLKVGGSIPTRVLWKRVSPHHPHTLKVCARKPAGGSDLTRSFIWGPLKKKYYHTISVFCTINAKYKNQFITKWRAPITSSSKTRKRPAKNATSTRDSFNQEREKMTGEKAFSVINIIYLKIHHCHVLLQGHLILTDIMNHFLHLQIVIPAHRSVTTTTTNGPTTIYM